MMRKQLIKNRFVQAMAVSALIFGQACTDLEPELTDSVSIESGTGVFGGVADPANSLESLYNGIENLGDQANEYALAEVTSDEIAVLTRGVDWSDNGIWRVLHDHTWNAEHLYVLNAWNNRNSQILAATQLLDPASSAPGDIAAQARVIRALNMYMVLDFFGQIPFRGVNEGVEVNPTVLTAQEAFDFIAADLNEAIASGDLSDHGPGGPLVTAGTAFAHMLRAKLFLNKEAFTGSATAADFNEVIASIDAIEALGFTLDASASYFDIWDPAANSEVIFILDTFTGNRVFNMLHPNQTGWNGFVILTEVFQSFGTDDPAVDARVGVAPVNGVGVGVLRGQQFNGAGEALNDRQGNPLIYEAEPLQSLSVNNERTGLRLVKYPQRNADGNPDPNNFAVFYRLSDALLMKAEAILRGGTPTGGDTALSLVNEVRVRSGAAAFGSIDLAGLLEVRLRELVTEGWRRNDQVRFGDFAEQWELKTIQEDFRVLFPIPSTALATNPNLVQNPGY